MKGRSLGSRAQPLHEIVARMPCSCSLSAHLTPVLQRGREDIEDVVVGESVVHVSAITSRRYEAGFAEDAELVADGRLRHVEGVREGVDAHLSRPQQAEDAEPGRGGYTLEQAHRFLNHVDRWKLLVGHCGGVRHHR